MARRWNTWGDAYWHYRTKGEDHGSCADRADEYCRRHGIDPENERTR